MENDVCQWYLQRKSSFLSILSFFSPPPGRFHFIRKGTDIDRSFALSSTCHIVYEIRERFLFLRDGRTRELMGFWRNDERQRFLAQIKYLAVLKLDESAIPHYIRLLSLCSPSLSLSLSPSCVCSLDLCARVKTSKSCIQSPSNRGKPKQYHLEEQTIMTHSVTHSIFLLAA